MLYIIVITNCISSRNGFILFCLYSQIPNSAIPNLAWIKFESPLKRCWYCVCSWCVGVWWTVVQMVSIKKGQLCKFIHIFKIFSVIFHFDFYCMLILFVTLGPNCIGFNYMIIRQQEWTDISVSCIRDYSIHGKYGEKDCCTFTIFVRLWLWYFSLTFIMCWALLWSRCGQGPGSCEHGSELSCSI